MNFAMWRIETLNHKIRRIIFFKMVQMNEGHLFFWQNNLSNSFVRKVERLLQNVENDRNSKILDTKKQSWNLLIFKMIEHSSRLFDKKLGVFDKIGVLFINERKIIHWSFINFKEKIVWSFSELISDLKIRIAIGNIIRKFSEVDVKTHEKKEPELVVLLIIIKHRHFLSGGEIQHACKMKRIISKRIGFHR